MKPYVTGRLRDWICSFLGLSHVPQLNMEDTGVQTTWTEIGNCFLGIQRAFAKKTHWECQNWKIKINSCSFQSTLLPTVLWYYFYHNRLSPVPCLFSSLNECLFLFQSIAWPRFSLCLWLGICLCVCAFPFFLFSEWHSFSSNSGFQASSILRPTISKFFQPAIDRGRYGGWVYTWVSFMGQTWRCIYDFWLYFTGQNLGTWINLPARGTEKCSSSLSTIETWTSFTESVKWLLLGSLKRIYALVQTMSILPCSLYLCPRFYYGSVLYDRKLW